MFKHFCYLLLLSGFGLLSCGKKGDYNSAFYKVFHSELDSGRYVINLTRHLIKADVFDTISNESKFEDQIWYSGTIIDTKVEGEPIAIEAMHAPNEKQLQLTYNIHKDTLGLMNVKISGDGTVLDGWMVKKLTSQSAGLPDSIPFKAMAAEPPKLTFRFFAEAGKLKVFDSFEYSPNLDYSFTVIEPVITQMDSIAYGIIKKRIYGIYNIPDTTTNPIQLVVERNNANFLKRYASTDPNSFKDEEFRLLYNSTSRALKVMSNTAQILTLESFKDDYSDGAAHNQYSSRYYSFNLQNGALLQLSDVLNRTCSITQEYCYLYV